MTTLPPSATASCSTRPSSRCDTNGSAQPSRARPNSAAPAAAARDVLWAVIQIGRGSSNVAQALRSHFGFSERLLSNRATRPKAREWFPRGERRPRRRQCDHGRGGQGAVEVRTPRCCPIPMGCCGSTATSSIPRARCSPTSSRCQRWTQRAGTCRRSFRPTGTASNCSTTGTDSVSAQPPAEARGSPMSRCIPHEVITVSDGKHLGHATAFLQLYLAAVAAGIAYGVLDDAVTYVRHEGASRFAFAGRQRRRRIRSSCGRRAISPPTPPRPKRWC